MKIIKRTTRRGDLFYQVIKDGLPIATHRRPEEALASLRKFALAELRANA